MYLVTAITLIVPISLYALVWDIDISVSVTSLLWFYLFYFIFVLIHECLHLLGFMVWGKVPLHQLRLGIIWRSLTPYAHCEAVVPVHVSRKAGMLPFWGIGILPFIIGMFLGNGMLVALSIVMIVGASGDITMYLQLRRFPSDALVQDHPSEIGCQVIMEENKEATL